MSGDEEIRKGVEVAPNKIDWHLLTLRGLTPMEGFIMGMIKGHTRVPKRIANMIAHAQRPNALSEEFRTSTRIWYDKDRKEHNGELVPSSDQEKSSMERK